MKKTAVLLYPSFSEYEVSVALSILMQGKKEIVTFGLTHEPIKGEAGLSVVPDQTIEELNIAEFDSLLLTGCMDFRPLVEDNRYSSFVQKFNTENHKMAAISSSGYLLAKAGFIQDCTYTVGLSKEQRIALKVFNEDNYSSNIVVKDGNILTARGRGFIEFGIQLGKMLDLEFDPAWYDK